ncbi:ABC transporter permease [Brenneria goodwinii]|uniref:ABC transporter permease n=1 Tax=Brenneria goodwinii TaxID=1109412 RepID=UPI000EF2249C|nr:ABC transporter permease [Brenneria goodwinii]MCG8158282.1 ABC transporter permease [Brenneria goodwinii]MCG8162370.1 ABC transporter permease [Brenneria goodwinii]MCG8167332.1 ABC transporter permease [Brenneria goodwinii]MCG8172000.1 ABC transporter permease [Brenneria goodwinii]MCG8175593.1 ABC transporter permease [Brenneria goodwinii]
MMRKNALPADAVSTPSYSAAAMTAGYYALLAPLLLLAGWWLASSHGWMSAQILPSPAEVFDSARAFIPEELIHELPISLWRLALGLAGGIFAGLLLGVLFGLSPFANRLLMPIFTVLVQIPTLAWIPLLMLALGIGEALKLTILIKSVAVPVALYTCIGIQQTPHKLYEAARSLRLPPLAFARRLILPAMLPYLMTGIRLAFSQGWVSLIAVELLASSEGLGFLLVQSRQLFMLDLVFVCILVIGAFGFLGEKLLLWLTRRWVHWPAQVISPDNLRGPAGFSLVGWTVPLLLALLWQFAAAYGLPASTFLPAPSAVARTLFDGLFYGTLAGDLAASLSRMLQGFALGCVAGMLAGGSIGGWPIADRLFSPLLSALRSVAVFAWLPLLTAWFGLGESAKIVFIALATFFPVLLATHQGIAQLPPMLQEVSRILQLTPSQRLCRLVVPGMLPALFSGLRLGLMHAWVGTIGAEYFISSGEGLGSMMMRAQQLLAADRILAGVALTALVAALSAKAIALAERRLTAWRFH